MVTIRVFVGGWRVTAHGDGVEISSLRKVWRILSGKLTMRSARVVMLVANGTVMLARSVNYIAMSSWTAIAVTSHT